MGGGTDGNLQSTASGQPRERLLRLLERRSLGRELELARQRLERQLPGSPSPVFSFSPIIVGEFFIKIRVFLSNRPALFPPR